MSKYINANFVAVMLALMSANISMIWLSDYYGYHKYHFYVEYDKKIIPADIHGVDFKSR